MPACVNSFLKRVSFGLTVLGMVAVSAVRADAQPAPPGIDHYVLYGISPSIDYPDFPLLLRDQFSPDPVPTSAWYADLLGVPVSKDGGQIYDPVLHWVTHVTQFQSVDEHVDVSNQFGDLSLDLHYSNGLVNPALKYPQPGQLIPISNHYKIYGTFNPPPPLNRPVHLVDQFGTYDALVLSPAFFLTPAEKTAHGATYPILRPDAHFVCYGLQSNSLQPTVSVTFLDQFITGQTFVSNRNWLCVPSIKHEVVPAEPSTWGSVKARYR